MTFLTILVSICVICAATFVAYGRENTWRLIAGSPDLGPFNLQALQRSHSPNDSLLCTDQLCAEGVKVDKSLPPYDRAADEIIRAIDQRIQTSGLSYLRVDDQTDPLLARYVVRSNIMRFPDTIEFKAQALANGKTGLIAYSRSQIGHSDLGVNYKRLVELTKHLH